MRALLMALLLLAGASLPAHGDCRCRYFGTYYNMGEQRCVMGQMAMCAMDQNVPTWRTTGKECPVVETPQPSKAQKG